MTIKQYLKLIQWIIIYNHQNILINIFLQKKLTPFTE